MKLRSATPLAGFSVLALISVAAAHCGSGIAPHPYGETVTTATPTEDGGLPTFTQYAPKGCSYTFVPSTTRPFTNYALDTQTVQVMRKLLKKLIAIVLMILISKSLLRLLKMIKNYWKKY